MGKAPTSTKRKNARKTIKKHRIPSRPDRAGGSEARAISNARKKAAGLSDSVMKAFSALSHRARVLILCRLLEGKASHRELLAVTNVAVGPLYHHLSQLRLAKLTCMKRRNEYGLTDAGRKVVSMAIKSGSLISKR